MVVEELVVSLSGGGPWGFRLQGGAEHQKPLQVAKVRKRSKACRAGLKQDDELVAIDDHTCAELSHAQAMNLIDTKKATLNLRVKRAPSALSGRSASPRSSVRVLSPPAASLSSNHLSVLSPTEGGPRCITSPPDSEAYYGETDSDADTQTHIHRRQRRTPPHARSPSRYDNQEEEETSEMSGYESAPDGGVCLQGQWERMGQGEAPPGIPRRELVYQPSQTEWATLAHTPQPLTPTPDQGLMEGEGEGDSGFQEVGGCIAMACPPLVSPERAKEALMLGSGRQLVPMVGPQLTPLSDELSTTYMDKARQAKLQRGESVVEKQVKEARTKCRSIASLLTDAPNPNSKGVLMFKKRRQRAKKYTLTCFGKAEGDGGAETEGETGGETEEEGSSSVLSGSEVDEDGFSASFDPTWDSGYLDLLDRRSSACPSTTPNTPTTPVINYSQGLDTSTNQSLGLITSVYQSPGLEIPGQDSSAYKGLKLESDSMKQPLRANPVPNPAHLTPPAVAMINGGSVAISRASVVLSPPPQTPHSNQTGCHPNPDSTPNPLLNAHPIMNSEPNANNNHSSNTGGVLNRTARPFTPGPTSSRSNVTPVMFRPPQPKQSTVTTVTKPVAAVSMVTIPPPRLSSAPEARRAVSSTTLYIPPRNNVHSPASHFTPPPPPPSAPPLHSSLSAPLSPPLHTNPPSFSPHAVNFSPSYTPLPSSAAPPLFPVAQGPPSYPSATQPFSPPPPHTPNGSSWCPPSSGIAASPPSISHPPAQSQVNVQVQAPPPPTAKAQLAPPPFFNSGDATVTAAPPQAPAPDSLDSREQRISVPAARTGLLQDARRRSVKKPMFSALQKKDVSPNPALLSMLQNMDDHTGAGGSVGCIGSGPGLSGDAGHESGPEEDWLRLGAEACNFMQAQRGPRPPPIAPKPQTPQLPQLGGKGGQLFARRQSRMDRYVVERSPSVVAAPYCPAQTREPSPTPSLPAAWKYSSNIRAPPPISYNPLLSPSCPLKAQKTQRAEVSKPGPGGSKAGGKKRGVKPVDIMGHKPYQLSSSLFSYGGGTPQNTPKYQQPTKTARVCEVKRFSTPPPTATAPTLKVIAPRSATTLGEPLWRSDVSSPPPAPAPTFLQHYQHQPQPTNTPYTPQWASSPLSPPPPPAPTAPLPQLPTLSSAPAPNLVQVPTFSHIQSSTTGQANRPFKSAPDLSPLSPADAPQPAYSSSNPPTRVPRPRFSTSNLGLQPHIWRPGSNMH
ncbi:synaptopodin 2-like protein [Lampris incognitus]|uniref:synaptopodin 2-like protein n=1 Tax=Lampris incognitus TaxID=2546036 RepID=UPI0024B60676|nr:synaptopodin 2-like protein [Lampris incognitus]